MRTIPIVQAQSIHADAKATRPGPAAPERPSIALTRRTFLKGTGILFGTLATGSTLALLAPSTAWALELKTLTTVQGQALLAMAKVLYPHAKLADAVYALLVKDLDAKARDDAAAAQQLRDGLVRLDEAAGGSFANAAAGQRLAAVKQLENTPFFETVRGQCITSLYDNEMAWAALGYEGPAFDKGGYLMRGFDDLKWLPAPDAADSPPPYLG